ncbi:hypothetical protein PC116_g24334 [Phytophthora cactorum]|uniref:Uncharacterized protein n=1 Tax=Phytophthora cactorum TaxID=29920 RepID=A0A8T1JWE1_9STRA|nr:hypothetical protein PC114_g25696 [Phytophthora cactorum]KAG2900128.1 hypothetical protein PC117_g22044 [Phytophthora cactorum]KAG2978345.1 hypothetical protein PC119_g21763 [Phytophthora cactorum]KAG4227275.1 hypothetical protein PC116_g24334 [Phytophthora cactorum]
MSTMETFEDIVKVGVAPYVGRENNVVTKNRIVMENQMMKMNYIAQLWMIRQTTNPRRGEPRWIAYHEFLMIPHLYL